MSTLILTVFIILAVGVIIAAVRMSDGSITTSKIMSIVITVILIGVGCGIIFDEGESVAEEDIFQVDTIYYDDYVPCASNTIVDSGSVEIVTISGESFAHATGTGEATVSSGNLHRTFTVEKAKLDVFMIAGQSNAEHGIYNRPDASPVGIIGTTYYYGTESKVITKPSGGYDPDNYDIYDMVGSGPHPIAANIDLPFAATYYKETSHKILVVNTGIAGTTVNSWMPGNSSYIYAKAVFNDAISKIDLDCYDVEIMSYIWLQGEGDSGTSQSLYMTKFTTMHNSFIGEDSDNVFYSTPFKNCLLIKVRAATSANASAAQINLAKTIPTVKMACTLSDSFTMINGLMLPDDLHYSQLGDNKIGSKVGIFAATGG